MRIQRLIPGITTLCLIFFLASCSEDSLSGPSTEPDMDMEEDNIGDATIWTGADLTFSKADGASPDLEANQDRITDNVWITRGNNGGQIYNVKTENSANKTSSPAGTEWAQGTLDNLEDLQFSAFRSAVGSPKDVVGKDLVLHLVDDNIYLRVRFTEWSTSKGGGFAYVRSTPN